MFASSSPRSALSLLAQHTQRSQYPFVLTSLVCATPVTVAHRHTSWHSPRRSFIMKTLLVATVQIASIEIYPSLSFPKTLVLPTTLARSSITDTLDLPIFCLHFPLLLKIRHALLLDPLLLYVSLNASVHGLFKENKVSLPAIIKSRNNNVVVAGALSAWTRS